MISLNKISRDRIVGGFGAAGGGWILFAIFMYSVIYPSQPKILPVTLFIGMMGVVLLLATIVIGLRYRKLK